MGILHVPDGIGRALKPPGGISELPETKPHTPNCLLIDRLGLVSFCGLLHISKFVIH